MTLKLIIISLVLVFTFTINYNYSNNDNDPIDIEFNSIINQVYGEDFSDTSTKYTVYKNEKQGFAIEYPSYWTIAEPKSGVVYDVVPLPFHKLNSAYLFATSDTYISISKSQNYVEFSGLSDDQYLDKMISNYEKECNDFALLNDNRLTCSNFEPVLSIVNSDNKHLSYMMGYAYTESNTEFVADKSNLVIHIPEHNDVWVITVFSTANDLPDHIEEIISILNSFTILDESQTTKPDDQKTTIGDSKNGGGCLIATATYGSEMTPQIQKLREIRDTKLLSTESGTSFMNSFNNFYYSFSPAIADYERENPVFKEAVKLAITPMISTLYLMDYADSESEVLGIGISLILLNIGMYVGLPIFGIVMIRKRF